MKTKKIPKKKKKQKHKRKYILKKNHVNFVMVSKKKKNIYTSVFKLTRYKHKTIHPTIYPHYHPYICMFVCMCECIDVYVCIYVSMLAYKYFI